MKKKTRSFPNGKWELGKSESIQQSFSHKATYNFVNMKIWSPEIIKLCVKRNQVLTTIVSIWTHFNNFAKGGKRNWRIFWGVGFDGKGVVNFGGMGGGEQGLEILIMGFTSRLLFNAEAYWITCYGLLVICHFSLSFSLLVIFLWQNGWQKLFAWNSAPREEFNFHFQGFFC